MEKWNEVKLVPEFSEQGVDCYRLAGGDYENEYYVVSEAVINLISDNLRCADAPLSIRH